MAKKNEGRHLRFPKVSALSSLAWLGLAWLDLYITDGLMMANKILKYLAILTRIF
jgi:hypothetical protein